MVTPEPYDEWRRRTKPGREAKALASTALLPVGTATVLAVTWGGVGAGELGLLLGFAALWALILLAQRRLLVRGAKVDDPRLLRLRWAQRGVYATAVLGAVLALVG
ncbi:hypothetical protein [Nocardioides daeguensis]|uniref:TIGR02611 family protein n=1 Tax=Nocardioides daeguensis TaxID=908359 RepID=A0ABP6W3F2_9ACTN|nr:hypothetical protein [Nocardioides daeguensis]MBV6726735.1 hypothetical protein [Nocardioides daeguensis]MCR1774513.1 hypothetical protein [Nocardioides daeguensis]